MTDTTAELPERERRELAIRLRNQGYSLQEVGDVVDRCQAWVSIVNSDDGEL